MNQRVLRAVDVELTAAAAERWVTPVEGFLWRARRCAEAMLYALLVEAKVDVTQLAEQGKGLDNLAKHAKLQGAIPREMRNHLEGVQKYGNTAAHFQADGPASDASASIVASALYELARWFYTRDDRAVPDALQSSLAALVDERQRLRSSAELALERERHRAHELTRRLDAATVAPVDRPPPFTARLAAIGVGLVALGGAVGFGAGRIARAPDAMAPAPALSLPPALAATPVTPVAPPVAPRVAPPIVPVEPAPAPIVARGMTSCPPGMQLVGARGEPGAFCIDQYAVLEGAYRRCVTNGRCTHPPPAPEIGCNWENSLNRFPANCLPWALARAYCQQRSSAADLPTRVEWQAVAASRIDVDARADTSEWSGDPAVGGMRHVRGAQQGATFAWSVQRESRGYASVSFRCVLRAGPP